MGSSASSVGMPRFSSSSTMWYRYLRLRSNTALQQVGAVEVPGLAVDTSGLSRSGMAKPLRTRCQRSSGGVVRSMVGHRRQLVLDFQRGIVAELQGLPAVGHNREWCLGQRREHRRRRY